MHLELISYDDTLADTLAPFVISFWEVHHTAVNLEQAKNTLHGWAQQGHRLFAIANGSQITGFLRTHNTSPTVCWIDDLYVDVPYRKKGIATAAIGLVENRLRAEGCKSFCMEVVPDNLPAMRLYHRLGYDRLSLITMRKDDDPFETERTETVAGLPMRIRAFR